jgi:hypothetical protein
VLLLADAIILGTCILWGLTGFLVCGYTHKQRGLEVDRMGIGDIVPPAWSDPVPADWKTWERHG